MRTFKAITVLLALCLWSCDNSTSLQEYYVENQSNNQFLALDIPASLLTGDSSSLTAEQKATMETIRKVNLIGYPMNEKNRANFEEEKEKITSILKGDKYHSLMRYGGGKMKAELYYTGEEDAIDEFIIFGSDEEKGFGVARVVGDDMNPDALIKLYRSVEEGDLDINGLQTLLDSKK